MNILIKIIKLNKLFLLGILSVIVIFLFDKEKGVKILVEIKNMSYEVLPILFLMFGLLAFLKIALDSDVIVKKINKGNGYRNNLIAYFMGMFISGPIYPGYTLGKILIEKGVKIRAIIILLSMWATLKIPFLPYEIDLFGIKLTLIRWLMTGLFIYAIAFLSEKLILLIQYRK